MKTITRRGRKFSNQTRHYRLGIERLEERNLLASWLGQIGGPGLDGLYSRQIVDSVGNSYLIGNFSQTADFGPSSSSPTNYLTSAGQDDAFLAKYAPDGMLLWAKRFGGTQHDWPGISSPVLEPSGNFVYLSILFDGSTDVTGDEVADLATAGAIDSCVLKLDANTGATQWFKKIGGRGDDFISEVSVDSNNRIYAVGRFTGTVDFDPGPGKYSLTATKGSSWQQDGFVMTLDSSGAFVSAWKIGGKDQDEVFRVRIDGSSLYLLGSFKNTVDFDLGPNTQNRTSAGESDLFLAQYSATTGSLVWVQTIGNQYGQGNSHSLSLDGDSLYLSGSVKEPMDLDPAASSQAILSSGNYDAFIARYSKADGSYVWAKQFGGSGEAYGYTSIADSGTLYLGGSFYNTVDFDPSGPGGELTSAGGLDGFVLRLDTAAGNFLQVWGMGGVGDEKARPAGVTHSVVDGAPHTTLYVTGPFQLTASFPTGGTLTSAGDSDIFRMALDIADPAPAAPLSSSSTSSLANDLALLSLLTDADGNPTGTQKKRF